MNQEIAERWAKALESGKFLQGKGYLKTKNGDFCCLGVLCEIAVEDGIIPSASWDDDDLVFRYGVGDSVSASYLPRTVREWAGMNTDHGVYDEFQHSLVSLNDDQGFSFSEIAKTVREHVETL